MFPTSYMGGGPGAGTEMAGAFSDPALGHSPDHATSSVDWRSMYSGELERLRNMTKEQDKEEAPHDWYRMMTMRLRMGMMGLPGFGGEAAAGSHVLHQGQSHQQHAQQHDELDDSGLMEEDEEEEDE